MSSTNVHSTEPQVDYGVFEISDKMKEPIKWPPEKAKEAQKEHNETQILNGIQAGTYNMDKDEKGKKTRVDVKGNVLSGTVKKAKEILNEVNKQREDMDR